MIKWDGIDGICSSIPYRIHVNPCSCHRHINTHYWVDGYLTMFSMCWFAKWWIDPWGYELKQLGNLLIPCPPEIVIALCNPSPITMFARWIPHKKSPKSENGWNREIPLILRDIPPYSLAGLAFKFLSFLLRDFCTLESQLGPEMLGLCLRSPDLEITMEPTKNMVM